MILLAALSAGTKTNSLASSFSLCLIREIGFLWLLLRVKCFILPSTHFQEYDWLKASACKPCIFDIRLVGRRGLSHTRLVVELRPFIFLIR